jgi:hypothetical protein
MLVIFCALLMLLIFGFKFESLGVNIYVGSVHILLFKYMWDKVLPCIRLIYPFVFVYREQVKLESYM